MISISIKWSVFINQLLFIICGHPNGVIVQLFEWPWLDIARECELFLGPNGYAGVQTSPASENLIMPLRDRSRTWMERYEVMSYIINTRSGDEKAFLNMTTRCNAVGVRIYVDVVLNHMTNDSKHVLGTAGSKHLEEFEYTTVPYNFFDFNFPACTINDYLNVTEVRNCMVDDRKDLNQTTPHVRFMIISYLNKLISLGVAGFRVDAANHMWPKDLKYIYNSVNYLSTDFGFQARTRPFFYQDLGPNDRLIRSEYMKIAYVSDFFASEILTQVFTGVTLLASLVAWGHPSLQMWPNASVVVFVDNHFTQRHGGLSHKNGRYYRAAIAFLLAHPYGLPRIMSSYYFTYNHQGPPSESDEIILSPITENGECFGDWVCEHRWNTTIRMLKFRQVVKGTKVRNWWDNGGDQIAFSRGNKGFIAINVDTVRQMIVTLPTGLPPGVYCDIRSGYRNADTLTCTGKYVTVSKKGLAEIFVAGSGEDVYLAIHVGAESRI